jgi:rhodanese-related sulfurtransferase
VIRELVPVMEYCASERCQDSHRAAKRLNGIGLEEVSVYAGGKADWKERGYPPERPACSRR